MSWNNWATDEVPQINTFKEASSYFDSVDKPFKSRPEFKPAAARRLTNRTMRRYDDKSIGFGYFNDEIVRYYPNGQIDALSPNVQRQGGFVGHVLPAGVGVDIATRRTGAGPILYLGCGEGGHTYNGVTHWSFWSEARTGDQANDNMWVVRGATPVRLRRCPDSGYWRPTKPKSLEPFTWSRLDKKAAREVSAKAGIASFVSTMDAIIALGGEIPKYEGSAGCWRTSDADALAALVRIEQGNFVGAQALLRRDTRQVKNPVTGNWVQGPERIISTEIAAIRTALYKREGVLIENSAQTMTLSEYNSYVAAQQRFNR